MDNQKHSNVLFNTILCNIIGGSHSDGGDVDAHMDTHILDIIKIELLKNLQQQQLSIKDCELHHIVKALKYTGQRYYTFYKHEIFYKLTNKPRPCVSNEQKKQMFEYFNKHENDYKLGKNSKNYHNFELIIKDIDQILGFNNFTHI
jgi:hypothetical protein